MQVSLKDNISPAFFKLFWDIHNKKHANYWLKGGRGSTKSSFISLMIVLGIMQDKDANAIVLRKVANTLRDSVFEQYLWAIDLLHVDEYWQSSVSPMQLTFKPTGQQIRFKGADDPRKIKSQTFRQGYTKFKHFEEVTEFKGMEEIRSINQSLGRGGSGIITFYSYNPPARQSNWVNQAVDSEQMRDDTLVNLSDYRSVPKSWLGVEFLADARQLEKDNEKAYRHEYLGEVTGTGAEVFNNITTRPITDDEIARFDKVYYGLDFGFAKDPTAFVKIYWDSARRRIFIFDEFERVGLKVRDAVAMIKERNPRNEPLTADSASPDMIAEYQDQGLNIYGAIKGGGSRDHGYKWLEDLREIIIDPTRCPDAWREFTSYEFEIDLNGNYKSGYPDGNDHTMDATRYALERLIRKGGFIKWN